jgi:hypothetical protein
MLAVGSIQPLISEKVSKGQLQFDIPRFLSEVVLPALDTSGDLVLSFRKVVFLPAHHNRFNNVRARDTDTV